jgi:hypothetical protein
LHLEAADAPIGLDLYNEQLQGVLLCHPSISQDLQLVAALLQTSKQLQVAVAQRLPGTLSVTLHVTRCHQVQWFGRWLRKHGGLLRELAVHVASSSASRSTIAFDRAFKPSTLMEKESASTHPIKRLPVTTSTELARALQHAEASGGLHLRSFSLTGATATCGKIGPHDSCACLWHCLPAATLTRLCAQLGDGSNGCGACLQAVAALSGLRSLQLSSSAAQSQATPQQPCGH